MTNTEKVLLGAAALCLAVYTAITYPKETRIVLDLIQGKDPPVGFMPKKEPRIVLDLLAKRDPPKEH